MDLNNYSEVMNVPLSLYIQYYIATKCTCAAIRIMLLHECLQVERISCLANCTVNEKLISKCLDVLITIQCNIHTDYRQAL